VAVTARDEKVGWTADAILKELTETREHHSFMESGKYKKSEPANELAEEHWEAQARSALFTSKRATELANLLSVRKALQRRAAMSIRPHNHPA
jgi:hypothetical protein